MRGTNLLIHYFFLILLFPVTFVMLVAFTNWKDEGERKETFTFLKRYFDPPF